ncbi:GntR family transcriptional regulator [Pluralibacter gergoviae]|uniref:GntR family transcriptional regulator n=1 Tax=Pluralibacter gergoviae TaxID=61647 RepID=UPI0004F705A6|nr:GntR family transcriptional regulator [Pluralibacter gergoviae]AIR01564.1 GntR family transcriptional regulator [Pluralibacter gergoviae]ELD4300526.1 GntR family transcriptional regulator [Pluralibacter gergoviae]KJM65810.1 GntR family transcriptional regulator [Pluralibacter gergoviae]MBK4115848.1 GntR family transcriptional regulator [Pluralibacter gergoviae]MCK1066246.1 GntR family transcriptional regulator [Pluralibacter gergoviae]
MPDFEKAQRMSLTTQVEVNLKSALIVGSLKPGIRLITREIAEQLGTSITPVREALLRLVSSGALQATPAQAFLVPEISLARFREVNQIRKNLEGMAAAAAAVKMTPGRLNDLRAHMQAFTDAIDEGDMANALQANCRFHFRLYDYAEMPTLTAMIEQLWVRIGPCFNYLQTQPCEVLRQHRICDELFSALERGDQTQSAAAICQAIDKDAAVIQRQYLN